MILFMIFALVWAIIGYLVGCRELIRALKTGDDARVLTALTVMIVCGFIVGSLAERVLP